jgi:RNA polymerase sigma-70 factor, ECF subfamily
MNLFKVNDTQVIMNDEQLVAALKAQESTAVQELLDRYGSRVLRSAFLLCGNEAEARDFVQETFLQAIRSAHRFQGRSTIYTWLHGILLNVIRHAHRRNARLIYDNELLNREVAPETASQLDNQTASSALRLALQRLSSAHREVIILRYYENMKIDEIARHLGVFKGTVKSRLHYAIQELQEFLPGELNLFGACDTEGMQQR